MKPDQSLDSIANEHRQWLANFDPRYLVNWEKTYKGEYEAAMTEASVRRMLQRHDVQVEPNESPTGLNRVPDFRCQCGGTKFYVEVTCILIATATAQTCISDESKYGASNYRLLTNAVQNELKRKAQQCGNLDAPALVAIGTFHRFASMICFQKMQASMMLTGTTMLSWTVNVAEGEQVGDTCEATSLEGAAFLQRDPAQAVKFARNSISGALLCGVAFEPCGVIGILHPNPARPFNPMTLPHIEFGTVQIDQESDQLVVNWPCGEETD